MVLDPQQHRSALRNQILRTWIEGSEPSSLEWQQLEHWLLADEPLAKAFGITPANVTEVMATRSHLLQSVYPSFYQFCQTRLSLQANLLELLWEFWLPLALDLVKHRRALNRPLIQGILGGQGTGKTTLATILNWLLHFLGYPTVNLSLDDLYKTYRDRVLLQASDPRLIWRGPPGTHDIELGVQVLDQLRQPPAGQTLLIPRFDKSAVGGAGDRTTPEPVSAPEIILFEGWFVGVRPIDPTVFATPLPPIQTAADQAFARDMNAKLQDYLPLWERLDRLMILYPQDYRLSQTWRAQAEQQMRATGKSGMDDTQVQQFVEYFWKALHPGLLIQPLLQSETTDLVIELDRDHRPIKIYCP